MDHTYAGPQPQVPGQSQCYAASVACLGAQHQTLGQGQCYAPNVTCLGPQHQALCLPTPRPVFGVLQVPPPYYP